MGHESRAPQPSDRTDWQLADAILRLPSTAPPKERPEAFLEYVADELEALLPARVEIHWADVDVHPPAPTAPHHVRLNVYQHDAPYATLDVISAQPLAADARFALRHLDATLTAQVDALTLRRMRKVMRELRAAMNTSSNVEDVSRGAVEVAVRYMGAEAGLLLLRASNQCKPLAKLGEWPADPSADSQLTEIARAGLEAEGPLAHADTFVTVPVATSRPARCVLLLRFSPLTSVHSLTFPVLAEMASVAAPMLDARWRDRVFTELLELNRASEETTTAEMYHHALTTALRLVPGADSGTLLTRTSASEPFQYQAAVGFDLDLLALEPVNESAARTWYGADQPGWRDGTPRVLTRASTDLGELGATASPNADPSARRYDRIMATMCLPVLRDGEVMAILNLDNLESSSGFGNDSVQLAYLFGAPLASLLHRQNTRDQLRKAALTDELTGLANRRAFNDVLKRELQRAERGGTGPSVLHMDLHSFKAINDAFGHDVGDRVLQGVAAAIRANIRTIDLAARYGGDEFMAILVDTPNGSARNVAERIREAVAGIDVGLGPLHIDIGVASYESDGRDGAELVRVADDRMYASKRKGR